MPELAILMPVYNNQPGLERTLASLREDGIPADVFLVDDGSTEPLTAPKVGPAQRVFLYRTPKNLGVAGALNYGLQAIFNANREYHYRYVGRLDAGDLTLPGRFSAQIDFLDANPDHAVVGCWSTYVDGEGRKLFDFKPPTDHAELIRFMRRRNGMLHSAVTIRLDRLLQVGGYREKHNGAEDYDLWRRLGKHYKLANLPEDLTVTEIARSGRAVSLARPWNALGAKLAHYDGSFQGTLGIARTLVALLVPRIVVLTAKQLRKPKPTCTDSLDRSDAPR